MVLAMDALDSIAASYKSKHEWSGNEVHANLHALYIKYVSARKLEIVDSIAVGVALESLLNGDKLDLESMPPDVIEAFHLAFPHVSLESLNERSHEEILGFVNAWKGKLFEIEVQDQLNAGMQVGDWQLEAGQHAELAESTTQPGWDLSIMNDDGSVADLIQLKSTDSTSYINEALDRYPDVPIVATSDVAAHANGLDAVSTANISNDDTTSQVQDAIGDDDSVTDALFTAAPGSVIFATEAWQVIKGKKTVDQAIENGGTRVGVSAVAGAFGWLASLALGPVGILAGIGASLFMNSKLKKTSSERYAKHEKEINPRQQLKKNTATPDEAKKAYQQLENITGRLLLEYKPQL